MWDNFLNLNEFWYLDHHFTQSFDFINFRNCDCSLHNFLYYLLSSYDLLNCGIYRNYFFHNSRNLFDNFLHNRDNLLDLLDSLINDNFLDYSLDLFDNNFLFFYRNDFLNHLRNLHNSFLNILFDDKFLYYSIHWHWNLDWGYHWFFNLD